MSKAPYNNYDVRVDDITFFGLNRQQARKLITLALRNNLEVQGVNQMGRPIYYFTARLGGQIEVAMAGPDGALHYKDEHDV